MLQIRSVADPYSVNGVAVPSDRFVSLDHFGNHGSVESTPSFHALLATLSKAHQDGHVVLRFAPFVETPIQAPGAWNIQGDQAFAQQHPLSWNYLDPASPNHVFKNLQKQIYLNRLEPWLDTLPDTTQVLDVGGGIGRFGVEWLTRGYRVALCEPNPNALVLALGHLANTAGNYSLWQLPAEDLSPFPDASMDLVSAFEVMCYLSDPKAGFREAARVLRPGGLCFVSVESTWGAQARGHTTPNVTPETFGQEGDVWVHFYTRQSLQEQLEGEGLQIEALVGVQYLLDGPKHESIDYDRLNDDAYQQELIRLDRDLDDEATLQPRAWLAIARKA